MLFAFYFMNHLKMSSKSNQIVVEEEEILRVISETGKVNGTFMELEARFGNIGLQSYNYIRDTLLNTNLLHSVTKQSDYIINNERITIKQIKGSNDKILYEVTAIKKTRILEKKDVTYGFKLVLATEKKVDSEYLESDNSYVSRSTITRLKSRDTFKTDLINIDLTKVVESHGQSSNRRPVTNYEIEAEIIGDINPTSLSRLKDTIWYIIRMIQNDSHHIYTNMERTNIINFYNETLKSSIVSRTNSQGKPVLSHAVLSNARNLRLSDCKGGMIYTDDTKSTDRTYKYTITHKADGDRKILVFGDIGIWLVYPPYSFNLLLKYEEFKENEDLTKYVTSLKGTIFDGENIPIGNRIGLDGDVKIKSAFYYVPFDCMADKGVLSIQNKDLFTRQGYYKKYLTPFNKFASARLYIHSKTFLKIDSVEDFFTVIKRLESERSILPFKTDGYLVTPFNSPYFTDLSNIPLHKRLLSVNPEICKLKPWDQLTIDFRFILGDNGEKTLMVNKRINTRNGRPIIKPIVFKGSFFKAFNMESDVQWDDPLFSENKLDNIIELGPIKLGNGDIVMKPHKIRNNKNNPNGLDIAEAVWNDIQRPLKIKTFHGETFDLLQQYHNQVKKGLILKIPKNADIVDIGFGRGGDVDKYRDYNKILAVEPNIDNINEYKEKRLANHWNRKEMEKRIKIINKGGEDSSIVEDSVKFFKWTTTEKTGRPFVISMMLSLSFFFGPEKLYNGLINNINRLADTAMMAGATKVYFIGMTIDGQEVKRIFNNKAKDLDLGPCQMYYDGFNTIKIDIVDTIVKDQIEYLVPTRNFLYSLKPKNASISKCDDEYILNANEKIFTSTFLKFTTVLRSIKKDNLEVSALDVSGMSIKDSSNKKTSTIFYKDATKIYVKVPNMDETNSIFEAISKCIGTGMSGKEIRDEYLKWLATPSKYTNDQIFKEYGGNPVPEKYRTIINPNINYYVIKSYDDKLKTIDEGYSGFEYIETFLRSKSQLPYTILDLLGYYLRHEITVYRDDFSILAVFTDYSNTDESKKRSVSIVMNEDMTYSSIGVQYGNVINYRFDLIK